MDTGISRALILAPLLAAALPATAVTVVRGPYLQQVTADSAIVVFDLDEAAVAEVHHGSSPTALDQVTPSTADAVHHEIALASLEADTAYAYGVFVGGTSLSEGHALRTMVPPGSPFTFIAYGDSRSGHDDHTAVVSAMAGRDARFILHTGDLVADGEDADQWDTYFGIVGDTLHDLPLYPVIGNHDEEDGEAALYAAAFALPGNEHHYSFDVGNAHFVVLDQYVHAELVCAQDDQLVDNCLDEEQLAWLTGDLAAARDDEAIEHIFVSAHEGPYSSKGSRDGSLQMRVLLPTFAEYGVTALITGHDHYYERGLTGNGIPYVITGGGGAGLYGIGEPSEDPHTVVHNASVHHFVQVVVDGETPTFTTVDTAGAIVDTAVFTAPEPGQPAADDDTAPPEDEPLTQQGCGCGFGATAAGGWGLAGVLAWLGIRRLRRRRRA